MASPAVSFCQEAWEVGYGECGTDCPASCEWRAGNRCRKYEGSVDLGTGEVSKRVSVSWGCPHVAKEILGRELGAV